jgi:hypothetical protein
MAGQLQSKQDLELIKSNTMYKDIAQNLDIFKIELPKTIVPIPNENDYNLGFIRRYFTQKSNDANGHVFEISEELYNKIDDTTFWISVDMKWRISGPTNTTYKDNGEIDDRGVINSNKASIGLATHKINNISLYLPNLLQFYK